MVHMLWKPFAVGATLAATLATSAPALSAPASDPVPATSALDWLATELAANGNAMPGFGATPDWGLTADALLAFASADRMGDAAAQAALDNLETNASSFVSFTHAGVTVDDAGAAAKLLLTLRSAGRSASVGGRDYEALVRSMIEPAGTDAGRVSDRYAAPFTNGSNGFDQALAILGLELTTSGAPTSAVEFLMDQQCADGGFRLTYTVSGGCTDASSDTDATALALMALLAVDRTPEVEAALRSGVDALVAEEAANGSLGAFGGSGPTSAINANSTGIAANALRAAGRADVADRSVEWLTTCCQITTSNAAGTSLAGAVGAIAYNPATLSDARTNGISAAGTDQWRRSTAQAVLAFGLPPYGPGAVAAVVTPPSTTTAPVSTSSTVSVSSTSGPASSTAPSTVASAQPEAVDVRSETSSTPHGNGTNGGSVLASTGTSSVLVGSFGGLLVAVGAVAILVRRRALS